MGIGEKLGAAFVEFSADDSKLNQSMTKMQACLAGLQGKLTGVATKFRNMFIGIAGSAAIGVKAFADFEKNLSMVSTQLSGKDMEWMPKYRKGIEELAASMGESTDTLSRGLYDILSATISPTDAMTVLEVATMAAKGGFTDASVAVDGLTGILNSYQLAATESARVSDLMFAAVKRGKMDYTQLASNIGSVAPMANTAKLSLEEMLSMMATLTRQNVSTDEASTRIVAMLRAFANPQDDAVKAAKKYGIELNTSSLRGEKLFDTLSKLQGLSLEELGTIVPDVRASSGLAILTKDIAGLKIDMNEMANSTGVADDAFRKYENTTSARLGKMREQMIAMVRAFGEAILPIWEQLSPVLMSIITGIKSFIQNHSTLTSMLVAGTAAWMGSVWAVTKLIGGVNGLIGGYMGLRKGMTDVSGIMPSIISGFSRIKFTLLDLADDLLFESRNIFAHGSYWNWLKDVATRATTAISTSTIANIGSSMWTNLSMQVVAHGGYWKWMQTIAIGSLSSIRGYITSAWSGISYVLHYPILQKGVLWQWVKFVALKSMIFIKTSAVAIFGGLTAILLHPIRTMGIAWTWLKWIAVKSIAAIRVALTLLAAHPILVIFTLVLAGLTYAFVKWRDETTLVLAYAAETIIWFFRRMGDYMAYGIQIIGWFASNFFSLWWNMSKGIGTILMNIGQNIWNFAGAIKDWIMGKGWNFKWTGLLEGFKSTVSEFPKMFEYQEGAMEKKLQATQKRLADKIAQKNMGGKIIQEVTQKNTTEDAKLNPIDPYGKSGGKPAFIGLDEAWKKLMTLGMGKSPEEVRADKSVGLQQQQLDVQQKMLLSLENQSKGGGQQNAGLALVGP